jgi:hypothetical protein
MSDSKPLLILGTNIFVHEIADTVSEISDWHVAGRRGAIRGSSQSELHRAPELRG